MSSQASSPSSPTTVVRCRKERSRIVRASLTLSRCGLGNRVMYPDGWHPSLLPSGGERRAPGCGHTRCLSTRLAPFVPPFVLAPFVREKTGLSRRLAPFSLCWVAKRGLEIEEGAAARRKRTGAHPLGVAKILAQHPWTRPERVKKSPAPLLHAASKAMRQLFYEGFALFVAAFRTAAEKLKRGDPKSGLPAGVLPTGAAVRRRVSQAPRFRPEDRLLGRLSGGGGGEGYPERRVCGGIYKKDLGIYFPRGPGS